MTGECKLRKLHFMGNKFRQAGTIALATNLRRAPRLEHLDLSYNDIDEKAAKSLADNLLDAPQVTHLGQSLARS